MTDTDRMLNLLSDEKSDGNRMAVLVAYLRDALLVEYTSTGAKTALDGKLLDIYHGTRMVKRISATW